MGRGRLQPDDPLTIEIVRLYTEAIAIEKIGYLVYLSASAVSYRLKQAGVENCGRRGNALTDDEIEKLKSLKTDGLSVRKIAEQAAVSINTVQKYTRKDG